MVSPLDPRFIGDPSDWLAYQQLQAGTPDIFQITLSGLTQSVLFKVGTSNVGRARRLVSSYNIHFLALELAPPYVMFSLEGMRSGFAISDIILSTGAPGPGGIATASSTSQYGKAGYYFAAPVNQAGQESSYFAGPKMAPLPGNIVTSQTPPDVGDPDLVVTTETINGQSVRKLTFSATVPFNGNGIIGVFILNPGSGGTAGDRVPVTFTGGTGAGAEATAVINSNGGVGEIVMISTGAGYTTAPVASVAGVSAVLDVQLGPAADFYAYQIYMDNYFGGGLTEAQIIAGDVRFPGSPLVGSMYLLPDTPPTGANIDFYFVSISTTGSRRIDPTGAPSVTLVGGLT